MTRYFTASTYSSSWLLCMKYLDLNRLFERVIQSTMQLPGLNSISQVLSQSRRALHLFVPFCDQNNYVIVHPMLIKKASEYGQEIPQSHAAEEHTAPLGRGKEHVSHATSGKQSKATSSFFTIKIIAKLEGITKQVQNTEPTQTMGATINNKPTTTEPPLKHGQQPKPLGA